MTKYVIASSKEWFELTETNSNSKNDFIYFEKKEQLNIENLEKLNHDIYSCRLELAD